MLSVSAKDWISISSSSPEKADINLISSDYNTTNVRFVINGYFEEMVKTGDKITTKVFTENSTPLLAKGAPEVQKLTTSIIIPEDANMDVNIISSDYVEYENILLTPSKGNLYRNINPSDVAFEFGEQYSVDAFYPGDIAQMSDPYSLRDYRGQTLIIYPFQYNPVTKVLRVYTNLEIEISSDVKSSVNNPVKISAPFKDVYSHHFLNYGSNTSRYTPVEETGNMLIISYGDFMDAMQPYIDWKISTGIPVEIIDVATIGGSSQIKTFITDYYNTKGVTFVLLVGDAAQVPSSSVGGNDSDNNYVYIVGSDHYPDALIGRFSAENEDQVTTQVTRTLEYEMDPVNDNDWYTEAIGIASDQGPGDNNEYDYQHIRNINTDLLNYTYTYAYELFDGSQGGEDQAGNPSPSDVAIAVNSGATVINYTGHGSNTSWGSSGFSNSDVNNLTNVGKWPFIFSVACVNGNFVGTTCFAEAWLRAEDNGEPTGAIATIMSTINQSWNPPMRGQDAMDDILTEQYTDNIKHTFAGIALNGCCQMNDDYGSEGNEMTDTWTVFGDPSVVVRTDVPEEMTVTMPTAILLGTTSFTVECDAENGRAALTKDGVIISTAIVTDGEAVLEFSPMTEPGLVDLVITAYNYRPFITEVDVIAADGPYLIYASHDINDSLGNNNSQADYGETVFISVGVENLGVEDGEGIQAEISLNDSYVEIIDNAENYGTIPVNSTVVKNNGFEITLAENIPDNRELNFTMTLTDISDSSWVNEFTIIAKAPVLTAGEMTIDDSEFGNDNGLLDPGEQATITIQTQNTGHSTINNVLASLIPYNPYITMLSGDTTLNVLGTFGPYFPTYEIMVADNAPEGSIATMKYQLSAGTYFTEKTYYPKVGAIIEDWETGNFNKYDWNLAGNDPWVISSSYPYEGNFDVISGNIGDNQTSEFWIQYQVMSSDQISFYKKVSSEADFDKLLFYIDNNIMGEWSGTTQSWTKETFDVSAGVHKFRWVYQKDYSGNGGADQAWIDYIELPSMMITTVYAGPDDYTCENSTYQCDGTATNFTSIEWETSGSGSFDNNTVFNPVYTPSDEDVLNGNVQLSLTIVDVDGLIDSDTLTLSFNEIPSQALTPNGPVQVDLETTTTSVYSTEPVDETDYYAWSVSPATAGVFDGTTTEGTITWDGNYAGTAWIMVTAVNNCGEGNVSDSLQVIVANPVSIDNNEDANISLLPNPNNGSFTLDLSEFESSSNVTIINIIGSEIYSAIIDGKKVINLTDIAKGVYFISIENNSNRIVKKMVVK